MSARPALLLAAAQLRDQVARLQREVDDVEALAGAAPAPDRTALWAIAGHLQAFSSGCEACLRRALEPLDGVPAHGPDSHVRLLHAASLEIPTVRPAVLRAETVSLLDPYRAFRHVFRHGYGVDLDWSRMASRARNIRAAHAALARDVVGFCAFLDAAGAA